MILLEKIQDRVDKSSTDYELFHENMLYAESVVKFVVSALSASIKENSERHQYRFDHQLVRANSIGVYADLLEEITIGPASAFIRKGVRDSELLQLTQRATPESWQRRSIEELSEVFDILNLRSYEVTTKKPSLRTWFKNFSILRNKTKGHGAITQQQCSIAAPLLTSSIKNIVDKYILFERPWCYLRRNISGKYYVESFSADNDSYALLKSRSDFNYSDGVYYLVDGELIHMPLCVYDSDVSDVYLPNGNLKNNKSEFISYQTNRRKEFDCSNYMLPVEQLPGSQTDGLDVVDLKGKSFSNSPDYFDIYIDRILLQRKLSQVLVDEERYPIVTLVGRGGIGKTSLAIKVLNEIEYKGYYDLVFWFSARDIDLLPEGPKDVAPKVVDQRDMSRHYLKLVCPDEDPKQAVTILASHLTASPIGKALYVFDNFETVSNPLEIYEWINTYIRLPNKVLITSRLNRNFKADYPIEVLGMTDAECLSLINATADKLEITSLIDDKYKSSLIKESNGHPYVVKVMMGDVARTGKCSPVQRVMASREDILLALFRRTFNDIGPSSRRVFLTLCSWKSDVHRLALEAVLMRPDNEAFDVERAIDELVKCSLVDIYFDGEDELLSVPLSAFLFGQGELSVYEQKHTIYSDRELLMEFGATKAIGTSDSFVRHARRKIAAVKKRFEKNSEGIEKDLLILEYIASKFPKMWYELGELALGLGLQESALGYYKEYVKRSISVEESSKAWLKMSTIYGELGNKEGELQAISEVALAKDAKFSDISNAANKINNYYVENKDLKSLELKEIVIPKVISVMESRIIEANSQDLSRLAWLYLNTKDVYKAREVAERGLQLNPNDNYCRNIVEKLT